MRERVKLLGLGFAAGFVFSQLLVYYEVQGLWTSSEASLDSYQTKSQVINHKKVKTIALEFGLNSQPSEKYLFEFGFLK